MRDGGNDSRVKRTGRKNIISIFGETQLQPVRGGLGTGQGQYLGNRLSVDKNFSSLFANAANS
jgi:hypothetical protein